MDGKHKRTRRDAVSHGTVGGSAMHRQARKAGVHVATDGRSSKRVRAGEGGAVVRQRQMWRRSYAEGGDGADRLTFDGRRIGGVDGPRSHGVAGVCLPPGAGARQSDQRSVKWVGVGQWRRAAASLTSGKNRAESAAGRWVRKADTMRIQCTTCARTAAVRRSVGA